MMTKLIKRFSREETGAISMELIALGAAVGFAAIFATVGIKNGVEQLDEDRGYQVKAQDKVTTF